jgi:hypothetical protein
MVRETSPWEGDFLSAGGQARTVSAQDAEAVGCAEIFLWQRLASTACGHGGLRRRRDERPRGAGTPERGAPQSVGVALGRLKGPQPPARGVVGGEYGRLSDRGGEASPWVGEVCEVASAVGGGADLRLAGPVTAEQPGLRAVCRFERGDDQGEFDSSDAQTLETQYVQETGALQIPRIPFRAGALGPGSIIGTDMRTSLHRLPRGNPVPLRATRSRPHQVAGAIDTRRQPIMGTFPDARRGVVGLAPRHAASGPGGTMGTGHRDLHPPARPPAPRRRRSRGSPRPGRGHGPDGEATGRGLTPGRSRRYLGQPGRTVQKWGR